MGIYAAIFKKLRFLGERRITQKNLLEFYKDFMGLKPEVATIVRDRAYNEMTGVIFFLSEGKISDAKV